MKFLIVFLAIIYSSQLAHSYSEQSFDFTDQQLVFSDRSVVNNNLVYAFCNKHLDPRERNCEVVRPKRLFSNETLSCKVIIKTKNESSQLYEELQVVPFGRDKAILISEEIVEKKDVNCKHGESLSCKDKYIDLKTIHMSDCKIKEIRLVASRYPHPVKTTILVMYDDSYDVYYEYQDGSLNLYRKVTIDSEGKYVKGLSDLVKIPIEPHHDRAISPVNKSSREKGVFFIDNIYHASSPIDRKAVAASLEIFQPSGKLTYLGNASFVRPFEGAISTVNDFISACYLLNPDKKTIECVQYDNQYKLKFNITIAGYDNRTELFAIHNLVGGGFFLLLGNPQGSSYLDIRIYLVRILADGKQSDTQYIASVNPPKCDLQGNQYNSWIYQNENGDPCVSSVCYHSIHPFNNRKKSHLSLTDQCYSPKS